MLFLKYTQESSKNSASQECNFLKRMIYSRMSSRVYGVSLSAGTAKVGFSRTSELAWDIDLVFWAVIAADIASPSAVCINSWMCLTSSKLNVTSS